MGVKERNMFVFAFLNLWLFFMHYVLFVQAVQLPRNYANGTLSQASRTTLVLEKLLDGYDKRLRPNFGGPPCKINISIHVMSIVPIKEIDMEVTAVVFFRHHWTDPRLAYGSSLGIPKMKLSGNIVEQVWLPDTFFVNDLSAQKSIEDYLFELTEEGHIIYSYRRKLCLYCPMDLKKFPMDEQICEMKFESYGYTEADVIYSWLNPTSLQIDDDLNIIQYTLTAWDQELKSHAYSTGNFTSMAAVFHFKRDFGFYLLQEFVPTMLVVALSWVGFWIDERSVPARVSLGITTVLAITTLMFGIQGSMPRVGHVKAIDVFLLGSFLFVFAALIEYAIICTFIKVVSSKKEETSKQKKFQSRVDQSPTIENCNNGERNRKENRIPEEALRTKLEDIQERDNNDDHGHSSSLPSSWFCRKHSSDTSILPKQAVQASTGQRKQCAIDKHCRKLFPLAYASFLTIYFAVYMLIEVHH